MRLRGRLLGDSELKAIAYEDPASAVPRVCPLVCPASCGTAAQMVCLFCCCVQRGHDVTNHWTCTYTEKALQLVTLTLVGQALLISRHWMLLADYASEPPGSSCVTVSFDPWRSRRRQARSICQGVVCLLDVDKQESSSEFTGCFAEGRRQKAEHLQPWASSSGMSCRHSWGTWRFGTGMSKYLATESQTL